MARKSSGKCSENPPRRGPMTVHVRKYTRKNGTVVGEYNRHSPRKK